MSIRSATADDSAACAAIYRPHVAEGWASFELTPPDADEMARRIAAYGDSHGWLVTEDQAGQVLGYAYACPHRSREAYSTSVDVAIYLSDRAQGQGLGRALYAALFDRLRGRGYHAAFAGIAMPNAASEGLHQAMGFTLVGIYRDVGYKMGGWRDVGWWQRLL